MFGALIRHGEKDLVSRPDIVGDPGPSDQGDRREDGAASSYRHSRRPANSLYEWNSRLAQTPRTAGTVKKRKEQVRWWTRRQRCHPRQSLAWYLRAHATTTSSPAIYTAPPTQSTPSTTPRVVSTWSSSTTTSSAPLTMGPSMGLTQALAGLSFNERDSMWPPTRPLAATSLGAVGPSPSRYDIPSLGAGTKTWPSNARQTPWGTRPKEGGHTRSGHQDGSREKIEDEEHERRDRPGARRPERADEDRANRRRTRERSDDREPEPETDDDEESNRRRVGFQRIGRSSLDRSNPRNDRDASYERQERSPYRASSPPTRMTGLQATKVLQSWHLSFDGENREEARNFLENVRDCKESNEIPTDKLLKAMPAILKGKAQRWFRENKRDLTTWIKFRRAFEDRYMKVLRDTTIRRDIDHRTQAKGEKIADYADCFLQLVRHLKQRPRDEELVEMFLQNVRNGYRRFIAPHRPWTIAEAVELGQEYERILEDEEKFEEPSASYKLSIPEAGFSSRKVGKIAAMTEIDDFSENEESDKADNSTPKNGPKPNGSSQKKGGKKAPKKTPEQNQQSPSPAGPLVNVAQGQWQQAMRPEDWNQYEMCAIQPYAQRVGPAYPTVQNPMSWPTQPPPMPQWQPQLPSQGGGQNQWAQNGMLPAETVPAAAKQPVRQPKGKFAGPCFHCQTPGHRAAYCPGVTCQICGQQGHSKKVCPNSPPQQSQVIRMSRRSSALAVTHKGFYCGHAQSVHRCYKRWETIGGTAGGPATVPDVTTEAREASEGESDEEDLLEHVIWVPEENDEAAEDMAWESGSAEKEDQAQETDRSKKGAEEFSRQQTSQLIAVNVARRAEENAASAVPTGEHNPEIPEIAGMCQENRHYAKFSIGGQEYIALLDPGANITGIHARVADRFPDRLESKEGWIGGAAQGATRTTGELPLTVTVDDTTDRIKAHVSPTFNHDMILGMDFMLKFDIDLRNKRYLWRANGGPWHSSKLEEVDGKPLMYAECAGISTCGPDELHKVEQLVNRCLPDDDPSPGVTNRSEHHIRVKHQYTRTTSPPKNVPENGRSRPGRTRPDFSRPFKVQSDASADAIGAVLTQDQEDGEHPIVYISRVLNAAERNYSTTERECLAVVWAIKKFRPYLEGYEFTVVTDHAALKSLQTAKEPAGRLARWALELQNWSFKIEHRKGVHMKIPDFLSRMPIQGEGEIAAFATIEDPWYISLVAEVEQTPQKFKKKWRVEDGLLYKFREDKLLDPIEDDHREWDRHLPELRQAINTSVQSTTKVSPAYLNFGRHPQQPKSLRREVEARGPKIRTDPSVWVDRVRRLDALRDLVAKHIDKAFARQKRAYDKGRKVVVFKEGDLVLRRTHPLSDGLKGRSSKMAPKFDGPFRIAKVLGPDTYSLDLKGGRSVPKVHSEHLQLYKPAKPTPDVVADSTPINASVTD
ncbi:unnamed protein product [Trichogramma brassicae]|uniref:CCHC-type domain-containing protein n=1 Tax=Trichogramma brassicae TaxID=86971 RepID=A0A6H5J042_9HYME|nr:unnamed protein product [Trichogramma brassicae]